MLFQPAACLPYEKSADTLAFMCVCHVKIVDKRTIVRIFVAVHADKPEHLFSILGDQDELIGPSASQASIPDFKAISYDFAIQEVIS